MAGKKAAKKEAKSKGPVPIDELREYTGAVEWAEKVRADAEKEITDHSTSIPDYVLAALDEMAASGVLSARERDLVTLWDGVGSRSNRAGSYANYHTLHEVLKSIACLPAVDADRKTWWLEQIVAENAKSVNFFTMKENHYKGYFESDKKLREVLRKYLAGMLDEIPTPADICAMLPELLTRPEVSDEDKDEQPIAEPLSLSRITNIAANMEDYRCIVLDGTYSREKRRSVGEVDAELREAGLAFISNTGVIESAEDVREALREFGAQVRGCAFCQNWFLADEKRSYPANCSGCGEKLYAAERIAVGKVDPRSRKDMKEMTMDWHLLRWVRSRVEETTDIAVKVALAEGTTISHARRMLAGDETSVETATAGLERCPMAQSCLSLCGVLQAQGKRTIPLSPMSGRLKDCHHYTYRKMVEGIEDTEAKMEIAKRLAEQVFELARADEPHRAAARAIEEMESGVRVADDPAPEATVALQSSLF